MNGKSKKVIAVSFVTIIVMIAFLGVVSAVTIEHHTLSKNTESTGHSISPVNETTKFYVTDSRAVCLVQIERINRGDTFRFEWYNPSDLLYKVDNSSTSPSFGCRFAIYSDGKTSYQDAQGNIILQAGTVDVSPPQLGWGTCWLSRSLMIDGYPPENKIGNWHVDFYYNDEKQFTETFTISDSIPSLIDVVPEEPSEEPETVSYLPDATKTPSGRAVLWDLTHGLHISGYDPSGEFSEFSSLVSLLSGKGYTVNTADAGILNIDLNQYGVLVIYLGSAWNSAYTTDEVAAVNSFVQNGGGLLVMGDNPDCPNENINPVAQAFGTKCGLSDLYPEDLKVTDLAPHPIFDGVSEFFMRVAGEVRGVPPSEEVAWTDSKGTITVATLGSGRVVVTGDLALFVNVYISSADNSLLAENIFDWLSTPASPVVSISTDKFKYCSGDTMTITIDISNPTEDNVTFEWYIGVPQLDIGVTCASVPISAGFYNSSTIPIPVGWGPTPFGLVHYVHMLDPVSGDVLVQDVALCAYSPGVGEAMPIDIEEEIKKTIEKVELP